MRYARTAPLPPSTPPLASRNPPIAQKRHPEIFLNVDDANGERCSLLDSGEEIPGKNLTINQREDGVGSREGWDQMGE